LYKNDKRQFAGAILDFLKINPILVFQFAIFLRWPSLASVIMVIAGGLIGHVVLNIFYMWMLINTKLLEKFGTYNLIQDCEFHPYSIRDFLDDETYQDLNEHFVKRFAPFDFDKIVRIYRVYRPGALWANMQSFVYPLFGADIFIPDKPSETRGISRLLILHEIGHSLMRIASVEYATFLGIRPHLFFLLWVSFSIQWDWNSAFVFGAYALSMLAWREEWRRKMESVRLNDEILADGFAFYHIDVKDIQRIAKGKSFPGLDDPEMDSLHNMVRMAKFREYVGLALERRIDEILTDGQQLLPKPQILNSLAAVFLTIIFGFYAPLPSATTIYCTLGVLGVFTILLLLLIGFRAVFFESFDNLLHSRMQKGDMGTD
jgi:hypothetical protein